MYASLDSLPKQELSHFENRLSTQRDGFRPERLGLVCKAPKSCSSALNLGAGSGCMIDVLAFFGFIAIILGPVISAALYKPSPRDGEA